MRISSLTSTVDAGSTQAADLAALIAKLAGMIGRNRIRESD